MKIIITNLPAAEEMLDSDFLVLQESTIRLGNSFSGILGRLEVHKAAANALAIGIKHDLHRQNVSENAEGIIQRLVVDGLIETIHEDVSNTGAKRNYKYKEKHGTSTAIPTDSGITLAPHNTAVLAVNRLVVHRVQGAVGISGALEVNIGRAKRTTSNSIATDTHRRNGANGVEDLKEGGLSDFGKKLSYPE